MSPVPQELFSKNPEFLAARLIPEPGKIASHQPIKRQPPTFENPHILKKTGKYNFFSPPSARILSDFIGQK
jgi:hypothetical protein